MSWGFWHIKCLLKSTFLLLPKPAFQEWFLGAGFVLPNLFPSLFLPVKNIEPRNGMISVIVYFPPYFFAM